jgi:hypothetical protein
MRNVQPFYQRTLISLNSLWRKSPFIPSKLASMNRALFIKINPTHLDFPLLTYKSKGFLSSLHRNFQNNSFSREEVIVSSHQADTIYEENQESLTDQVLSENSSRKLSDQFVKEEIIMKNPISWEILQYASHLDPNFIPWNLLENIFSDKRQFEENINNPVIQTLLKPADAKAINMRGVRMFRKPQKLCLDIFNKHPELSMSTYNLYQSLIRSLIIEVKKLTLNNPESVKIAEILYPHAIILVENQYILDHMHRAHVNHYFAYLCLIKQDYMEGGRYLVKALSISRDFPIETEDQIFLSSLLHLGYVLIKIGKSNEAVGYYQEVLNILSNKRSIEKNFSNNSKSSSQEEAFRTCRNLLQEISLIIIPKYPELSHIVKNLIIGLADISFDNKLKN